MRKFLSLFLAAILVLSSLCLPAVAQETETLSGSGTEDSPYLIKTAADFATAKKMIAADYEERVVVKYEEDGETPKSVSVTRYCANGVYFKLAPEVGNTITIPADSASSPLLCDLVTDAYDAENPYVLEDTEITTANVNQFFVGHLDGNNVTVTFEGTVAPASVTPGGIFFCYIGGPDYDSDADEIVDKTFTASVKNLTISSLTVAYSNDSASGQFAVLTGSVNGTASIDNVDVLNVTFTDSSASNTHNRAAIVGKHNGGNCTVENCDVTGSFTGTGTTVNLGSIVGSAGASSDLLIKNCTANVNLTANKGVAGGIVAQFAGSGITTVQNCTVNTAQGAGENAISAGTGTVGGIVGNPAGAGTLNILNCVVDGVVTATNYAGGATGSVTKANETVTVEGFTNKADVQAKHAGAVFARANQIVTLTAKNIINEGTIAGGNDAGTASAVIGTITAAATLNVTNLYNKGTLKGYQKSTSASATGAYVGLVIGDSKATVNASYIINSGTISSDYVLCKGLFAGRLQSGALSLTNCYNFATTGLENVHTPGSVTMNASDVHDYTALGIAYAGPATHNDFFRVLDGARIRLDVDEATENGLRFDIAVDANLVQALKDAGYTVQLKSLMAYANNVTAATFNKATLDAAGVRYSDSTQDAFIKANGTYSAALINFAVEQYSKNIACVGYIEATKGGETIYFYTAYDADNARSVAQVANAALEDETVDYSAYTEILNTFAGK